MSSHKPNSPDSRLFDCSNRELKAIWEGVRSRAFDSLGRELFWVMVLLNNFYLLSVVLLAGIRELNCRTLQVSNFKTY